MEGTFLYSSEGLKTFLAGSHSLPFVGHGEKKGLASGVCHFLDNVLDPKSQLEPTSELIKARFRGRKQRKIKTEKRKQKTIKTKLQMQHNSKLSIPSDPIPRSDELSGDVDLVDLQI